MVIERQTAHKIWIKQIQDAKYVKQGGWNPNYVEVDGKQVSRVHILATVVGKFSSEDGNYGAITLDDGSDTIRSKAFGPDAKLFKNVDVGKVVRFIGKVKEYNEETYVAPEVIRAVKDPNWVTVWKLELGNIEPRRAVEKEGKASSQGTIAEAIRESKETKPEAENPSGNIIEIIKELDNGKGAEVKKIVEKMGMDEADVKALLAGLLKSGDVFEPKKDRIKLLE